MTLPLSLCLPPWQDTWSTKGQLSHREQRNSVCSWVLQEFTHLQRQNAISRLFWSTVSVCPCSKPKQVSDGHVLSPALLCVYSLPRKDDGDKQRKVCHVVPDLPHSQALPGDEEKIIQQILNEKIISPDFPFSQQKKTTKPEPSASLCLAHWGEMDMSKWFLLHPHHCGQWEVVRGDQD